MNSAKSSLRLEISIRRSLSILMRLLRCVYERLVNVKQSLIDRLYTLVVLVRRKCFEVVGNKVAKFDRADHLIRCMSVHRLGRSAGSALRRDVPVH